MLNTVQHTYMIKVFHSINEEKTNRAEILNKVQLCVTKLFTLFQFSPQNIKSKQKLTFQYLIVMYVVRMVIF